MDLNKKLFDSFNETYSSLSKQTKGLSLRQREELIYEVMNTFTLFALKKEKKDFDEKKELLLMITHCQEYFNLVKKAKIHKYMKVLATRRKSKSSTRRILGRYAKKALSSIPFNKTKKGGYKVIRNRQSGALDYRDDDYELTENEILVLENIGEPIPSESELKATFKEASRIGGAIIPEVERIRIFMEELNFDIQCELIDLNSGPPLSRISSNTSDDVVVDIRPLQVQLGALHPQDFEPKTGEDLNKYVSSFESFMTEIENDIREHEVQFDDIVIERSDSVDSDQSFDIEYMKDEMTLASLREIQRQITIAKFKSIVEGASTKDKKGRVAKASEQLKSERTATSERFGSMMKSLQRNDRLDRLRRELDILTEERRYGAEVASAISEIPRLTESQRAILEKKSTMRWLDHVGILARASCFGALCGFYQTPSEYPPLSIPISEAEYERRFREGVEAARAAAAPKERAALLESFETKLGFKDILHITNTVIEVKKDNTFIEKDASVKIPFSSGTLKKVGESLPLVTVDTYADAVTKTISELAEKNFSELRAKALENTKKGVQVAPSKSELVNDIATGKLSLSLEQPHIRAKLKDMLKDVETPVLWREEPIIEEIIGERLEQLRHVEGFDSMADIPKYLKEKIENFKRGITTVGSDTFNYALGSCCCSLIGEYAVKCDEMIEARQTIKSADADYRRFKEIIKELEKERKPTEEITTVMRSLSVLPPSQRRSSSTCINTGALFSAGGAAVATASSLLYAGGAALNPAACVVPIVSSAYIGYVAHKKLQLDGDVEDNLAITTFLKKDKKSKGGKTHKQSKRRHRRTARKN